MKKLVPDPPITTLQDAAQCDALSLDRAATDRALDYVNLEAALAQASDLLRCAGASASEAGNGLSGHPRHLVLSVMHLVELANAYVDKSLDGLTTH